MIARVSNARTPPSTKRQRSRSIRTVFLQCFDKLDAQIGERKFSNCCCVQILSAQSQVDRMASDTTMMFCRFMNYLCDRQLPWVQNFRKAIPASCYAEYLGPSSPSNFTRLPCCRLDPQGRQIEGTWTLQIVGPYPDVLQAVDAFFEHTLATFKPEVAGSKVMVYEATGPTGKFPLHYHFMLQPCGLLGGDLLALSLHCLQKYRYLSFDGSVSCPCPLESVTECVATLPNREAVLAELDRREIQMVCRYLKLSDAEHITPALCNQSADPRATEKHSQRCDTDDTGSANGTQHMAFGLATSAVDIEQQTHGNNICQQIPTTSTHARSCPIKRPNTTTSDPKITRSKCVRRTNNLASSESPPPLDPSLVEELCFMVEGVPPPTSSSTTLESRKQTEKKKHVKEVLACEPTESIEESSNAVPSMNQIIVPENLARSFYHALEDQLIRPSEAHTTELHNAAEHLLSHLHNRCDVAKQTAVRAMLFKDAAYWKTKEDMMKTWTRWPQDALEWTTWLSILRETFPAWQSTLEVQNQEQLPREREPVVHNERWRRIEERAHEVLTTTIHKRKDTIREAVARADFQTAADCSRQVKHLKGLWSSTAIPIIARDWKAWLTELESNAPDIAEHMDDLRKMTTQICPDMQRPALDYIPI